MPKKASGVGRAVCRKLQGKAEAGNACLQNPGTCDSCPEWAKVINPPKRKSVKKMPRHLSIEATLERHTFWRVYIVMARKRGKFFTPYRENPFMGRAVVSFETKNEAIPLLREAQKMYGKKNAYIQMCGAYR